MKLYADIAKTEDQDDGTIKVWGWASTGAVDSDGEIITPEAMKAALPDYMKFGAVREMHQSKAAGTAIEAEVKDDGKTWFGAHVVDSEAVRKVKANVYKGFSIGGKVTDRDEMNKSIIKGIKLVEVSLVDRPANPEAVITIMKAERTAEDDVTELAEMLDKGTITPGRLIELAKADFFAATTATEVVATQPEQSPKQPLTEKAEAPDLAKYAGEEIQDAGCALACLDALYWLMMREQAEAAADPNEPSGQVANLKAVIDNLKAFIASEIAEDNSVQMGEATGDLAKAGARYSRATKEALGKAYGCMKEAMGHMDSMKWQDAEDDDDGMKAEQSDGLAKAQADTITKLNADLDALKAEIKALKDQPLPGKALLKAITVAKSDDSIVTKTEADPALTLKGEALALHQLKTMYRAVAR